MVGYHLGLNTCYNERFAVQDAPSEYNMPMMIRSIRVKDHLLLKGDVRCAFQVMNAACIWIWAVEIIWVKGKVCRAFSSIRRPHSYPERYKREGERRINIYSPRDLQHPHHEVHHPCCRLRLAPRRQRCCYLPWIQLRYQQRPQPRKWYQPM